MPTLKSPNLDDVFIKWLNETPITKLEKQFKKKKVAFNKDQISIAETVTDNDKFVICFFQSKRKPGSAVKGKEYKVDAKKIQKVTFYDFTVSDRVDKDNWKGNDIVPMLKTLNKTNCPKCSGKGQIACKKCKGNKFIKCGACDGSGYNKCKNCDGIGEIETEIKVLKGEKQKKEKNIQKVQCPTCFGSGKLMCQKCAGSGKVVCPSCKGEGGNGCNDCLGYGVFYNYQEVGVPYKAIAGGMLPHLIFKKEYEKYLGEKISEVGIEEAAGIKINDIKQLNRKGIEPQLGYWDKSVDKLVSQTKNTFKQLEKDPLDEPKYPIYLFPLLELDCKTPKGKKFQIFSIGTDQKYIIIDHF